MKDPISSKASSWWSEWRELFGEGPSMVLARLCSMLTMEPCSIEVLGAGEMLEGEGRGSVVFPFFHSWKSRYSASNLMI